MSVVDVISIVLLLLGGLVMLISAAGVLRFPDFYSRLHAGGKGDTLGQRLVLLALAIAAGFSLVTLKLLLIIFFIFIFNPTATHALARGAWISGVKPWSKPDDAGSEETHG